MLCRRLRVSTQKPSLPCQRDCRFDGLTGRSAQRSSKAPLYTHTASTLFAMELCCERQKHCSTSLSIQSVYTDNMPQVGYSPRFQGLLGRYAATQPAPQIRAADRSRDLTWSYRCPVRTRSMYVLPHLQNCNVPYTTSSSRRVVHGTNLWYPGLADP